jgi:hypothetical protein
MAPRAIQAATAATATPSEAAPLCASAATLGHYSNFSKVAAVWRLRKTRMGRTVTFRFEELPLVVDAGFAAGEVSGTAEISYHHDGEWGVRAITLDGARRLTPAEMATLPRTAVPTRFARRAVALDNGDPLFLRILDRLEHEWADRVRDAVSDQITSDRAARHDNRHDARRSLRFCVD